MKICRFRKNTEIHVGLYRDDFVLPLLGVHEAYTHSTGKSLDLPKSDRLLDFLPPDASGYAAAQIIDRWTEENEQAIPDSLRLATDTVELLIPISRPKKLFLLAGNYAKHIEEGGGIAAERAETFPYVFMKPPTTTLTDPGKPITIPSVSPNAIDWELELAVIIGRRAKGLKESAALQCVAGYTVINDISNRDFRPNPQRKQRTKDAFFDWLHGKWHDSFCPCGPCVTSADAIADPQQLELKLTVNGNLKQDANTAQQIFPVAAVIEFISSFVTLEPGDIISTGTAAGVGNTTGDYLQAGDRIEASISDIGTLVTHVIREQSNE